MHAKLLGLSALLLIGGCQPKSEDPVVSKAWIRLAAVKGQPAAAYFTISGGARDDSLYDVHNDYVVRTELHESMAGMQGMTTMKPLGTVPVAARASVVFAPAGKHVMLYTPAAELAPGARTTLDFVFKSGVHASAEAVVVAAGDPDPKL